LPPVLDLLATTTCLGCETEATTALCPSCAVDLEGPLRTLPTRRTLLHSAHALGPYNGTIGTLVRRAKFESDRRAARLLRAALDRALATPLEGPAPTTIVAVPTTPWRLALRGFHLPEELATAAAARLGAPVLPLLRRRWGLAQAARTWEERLRAGDDLFAVRLPVEGPVLLIDDVVTSGTTLHAAAAELLAAGATSVSALVLAAAGPLRRVAVGIS
jgi:predicted amidophosphoribosyltransferase